MWTTGGGMIGLGDLSGGIFNSVANDASEDGSVIVGEAKFDPSVDQAFRWEDGLFTGLGFVAVRDACTMLYELATGRGKAAFSSVIDCGLSFRIELIVDILVSP